MSKTLVFTSGNCVATVVATVWRLCGDCVATVRVHQGANIVKWMLVTMVSVSCSNVVYDKPSSGSPGQRHCTSWKQIVFMTHLVHLVFMNNLVHLVN